MRRSAAASMDDCFLFWVETEGIADDSEEGALTGEVGTGTLRVAFPVGWYGGSLESSL